MDAVAGDKSEQSVQRALIEALRKTYGQRIFVRKVPVTPMLTGPGRRVPSPLAGMPDILICLRGRFIGIELKLRTRKDQPGQADAHAQIRSAGGIVIEASTVEGALSLLAVHAM